MNDPFGQAINDYYKNKKANDIVVNSNYTENETIPVSYFFRGLNKMPPMEKKALQLCKGKILDIGAAAGCHSIVLQKKGFDVTALEVSLKAVEILKKRGINNVICQNIFSYSAQKFDTILLLMNGAGIGGTIPGLKSLLKHLQLILNEKGQILIDSSDIKYLFEEEDGSFWIDLASDNYYGEMKYEVGYKNQFSVFDWLFIDFERLKRIATDLNFKCEMIETGKHSDYLAKLTIS